MTNTIKIKRGVGVPESLDSGELAIDTSTGQLYSLVAGVITEINGDPNVDWDDVTGKPTEFPQEDHTHEQSEVDGLELRLDAIEGSITDGGSFVDAPDDAKLYGRQSEAWAEVVIPEGYDDTVKLTGDQRILGKKTFGDDATFGQPVLFRNTVQMYDAVEVTDNVQAIKFITRDGTSDQYLMADGSVTETPEMTSEATADTLVLRDGGGNSKFNLITAKNFTMNQPTISNNMADTWFLSGGEQSNHGVKKNDAEGMRSSLDVYSKAESDALGDGSVGEHDHTSKSTSNVAVGTDALKDTTGKRNTAVGYNTQKMNTDGRENTAIGCEAMSENIDGHYNTAVGRSANKYGSGNYNTSVGNLALAKTTGDNNVGIGTQALYTNETGSNLVAIGGATEVTETDLTNSVMIGYKASVDASNKIQLGNDEITLVHTHGAIQAQDFLDADGNSIVGAGGGDTTDFAKTTEVNTWNKKQTFSSRTTTGVNFEAIPLEGGGNGPELGTGEFIGWGSTVVESNVIGGINILAGNSSRPDHFPFDIPQTKSMQYALTVDHELLGRTVEIDKEGIIRANGFQDMEGNPIGGAGGGGGAWGDITDKPTEFPPEAHDHDGVYQPAGDYIEDADGSASNDGHEYARKNGDWVRLEDHLYNGHDAVKITGNQSAAGKKTWTDDATFAEVVNFRERIHGDTTASFTTSVSSGKFVKTDGTSDQFLMADGSVTTGNYAVVGASYTKAESDSAYQPKGSYALTTYAYSKSESDGKYELKGAGGGNYVPLSGNSTIAGTLTATDFVASSDERLKENITMAPSEILYQLHGREWEWKNSGKKGSGVIAQELEQVLPHLVHEDDKGMKSVAYTGLVAYLIEEVKALRTELEDLKQ